MLTRDKNVVGLTNIWGPPFVLRLQVIAYFLFLTASGLGSQGRFHMDCREVPYAGAHVIHGSKF